MDNWVQKILRRQAGNLFERFTHRAAGRMLKVFPDDSFLVSYPKAGSTWLRFLVANLLCSDLMTFLELEKSAPDIYLNTDYNLLLLPRPRVLKSHECFDPRYRKVVYLVRDPRDTALSAYYYHLKRREIPDGYPMDLFVSRWLSETQWEPRFGTWREHVLSWTTTRGEDSKFLLVRYEDLKKDPQNELMKVASFLGITTSRNQLARAVELSSADRMRKLEKQQHEAWGMTKGFRADVPFIRTAVAGGWKSSLSEISVQAIEADCGAVMRSLGYKLTSKSDELRNIKSDLKSVESLEPIEPILRRHTKTAGLPKETKPLV
jgi:hypothetical protein